eukprot:scaffold13789_cov143-Skeletonema_dohrnii-CCMP3373.AAC.5
MKPAKRAKLNDDSIRKEQRVTSGASIVIKNVLPFLKGKTDWRPFYDDRADAATYILVSSSSSYLFRVGVSPHIRSLLKSLPAASSFSGERACSQLILTYLSPNERLLSQIEHKSSSSKGYEDHDDDDSDHPFDDSSSSEVAHLDEKEE